MEAVSTAVEEPAFDRIQEGKATILVDPGNSVFYNKVQCLNRDLSILMISLFSEDRKQEQQDLQFGKPEKFQRMRERRLREAEERHDSTLAEDGITILEALSATGLRSIRYYKEIKGSVRRIVANDLSVDAVAAIQRNIAFNGVDPTRLHVNHGDAALFMHQHKESGGQFDVIDLDPYGSPSVFIDGAVQAVSDGGLLCITCTDLAVLCGNHMDACFGKYGSMPLKAPYCHEMALRIMLYTVESHANRYGRYITPLAAFSIDFYIRAFVKVHTSKLEVKRSSTKISMLGQCSGCDTFTCAPLAKFDNGKVCNGQLCLPKCEFCGGIYHIGGPIWSNPIFDKDYLERAKGFLKKYGSEFSTAPRILGLVTTAMEELPLPLYYSLHSITHTLKLTSPPMFMIWAALQNLSYEVSASHACPLALKTTAPASVLWDVFRAWHRDHPAKCNNPNTSGFRILSAECKTEVNFSPSVELQEYFKIKESDKIQRYPSNPEKYWGPKSRAPMKKRRAEERGDVECPKRSKEDDGSAASPSS